ncbi:MULTISPECIES: hypothetical protein [Bradyrhizobium]|nr:MULTISPECIES: hypothetical protein [Bradyrhizobium]
MMRLLLIPSFFLSLLYTEKSILTYSIVMLVGGTLVGWQYGAL